MKKLTKRQKSAIIKKYDGTYESIKILAKEYKVSITTIRWLVDHKGFRGKMIKHNMNWQKRHPKKFDSYTRRYRKKNKEKIRKKAKIYWKKKKLKNVEK